MGFARSRWTLRLVGAACPWLTSSSSSGVWRVLKRAGIRLKRARSHLHSPDPAYLPKQTAITAWVARGRGRDRGTVTLFLDEVTLARQPTLAAAYAARGPVQPLAERSCRSETATRYLATLDVADGRVCWCRRAHITVATLVAFYRDLVAAYPEAARIVVVQDNWPVHVHPDLLVALEPQESPFPVVRPPNWPIAPSAAAERRWGELQLPIQLVPLPTYASWLNPIEKLWRWLRQDVGHLHPWADDLDALRAAADDFLTRFAHGSPDLLRYSGLLLPE